MTNHARTLSKLGMTLALLAAAACSRNDTPAPATTPMPPGNPDVTTENTAIRPTTPPAMAKPDAMHPNMGPTDVTTPATGTGMAATHLTDGDVAQTTKTINEGETDQAKYAVKNAKSPAVKQFAEMMITDHKKALDEQKTLLDRNKLSTHANDFAKAIETKADATFKDLKSKKGDDFDKAYMDAQIKEHQDALDTLDKTLIPTTENEDFKGLLAKMRGTVAMHLAHAKQVRGQLP